MRLSGWVRYRLTSARCAARLGEISREIKLRDVVLESELAAAFTVSRSDAARLRPREGERLEVVGSGGLPKLLARMGRWKLLTAVMAILLALTVLLPKRILFVRVEGNGPLPARLIRERAEECGVYFGASRGELRSEQVKNHLLWAIPELRWAGVNTQGCIAVITVAVRDGEAESEKDLPGDIIATVDAVVTDVFPMRGTLLTAPGRAVRAGETLISGMTDLGICTHLDRAAGEVYGLTRREVALKLPENNVVREPTGEIHRAYALIIGKKYVNFSNHSGNYHESCVRMRTVNYLKLPGGFSLPAALVTETCHVMHPIAAERENGQAQLLEAAHSWVRSAMTAGEILVEDHIWGNTSMDAVFECKEMIGTFRPN